LQDRDIEPFYFGTPERRLLGLYHPAKGNHYPKCGVVLCYPMAREYLLAHRSFRQLAGRLSQAGFPVVRFDFSACGDSYGTSEEGNLQQWLGDISIAVAEMRKRAAVRKICLVGLRLGATLALRSALERSDIDSIVLWNPVVSGKSFVQEMRSFHRTIFKHLQVGDPDAGEEEIGVLGFRLTDSMRTDLEMIDLYAIDKRPAAKVLVIHSEKQQEGENFARHLTGTGARVDSKFVPFAPVWTEGIFRSHVPAPVLASIVSWISEVNA